MAQHVKVTDVYTGRRAQLSDAEYNEEMRGWAQQVQRIAKQQASAFHRGKRKPTHTYTRGHKAGKTETRLRTSIQYRLKSDSGEVAAVAFKFPVHGIFREYGVSNGHHRGNINRAPSDWMSGTLQRKDDDLLNIVAEHQSGAVINKFMGINK